MKRIPRLALLVLFLLIALAAAAPAGAQAGLPCEFSSHGTATWMVCIPPAWNGDMVVYAHGYAQPAAVPQFENLNLPDGTSIPATVMGLGMGFATTTYPKTGLAILEGTTDVQALIAAVKPRVPGKIYVVGVSEGGLVATRLAELPAGQQLAAGALALCGPIGDFRKQINYLGDFRVLFDYFYPGLLPPSPVNIPPILMNNWDIYTLSIFAALQADPSKAAQLIRTSRAAIDPADPTTVGLTTRDVAWYNVFATNEAKVELGGQPFDNRFRLYLGSSNDWLLNRNVQRFTADMAAVTALARYQTTGRLTRPLVTLHTFGDPIVPFWHEVLYAEKAALAGKGRLIQIPIFRYGHCAFSMTEVLAAFGVLYTQVNGRSLTGLNQSLSPSQIQSDWQKAKGKAGGPPADR